MDSDSKIYYFYATMLPPSLEVHVRHTVVNRVGRFYGKDERGEIGATAKLAARAREEARPLALFLLEEYPCESDIVAYQRCIAWERRFSEAGYALLSDADRRHVEHMSEAELAHYEVICDRDVIALCAPERDLAPGILAARRPMRDSEHPYTVRVQIVPDLYDALTRQARAQGKKLPEFLLSCAADTPSTGPDMAVIAAYYRALCRFLTLLRLYTRAAENAGVYDPDAIKHLHASVRRISADLERLTQLLTEWAPKK